MSYRYNKVIVNAKIYVNIFKSCIGKKRAFPFPLVFKARETLTEQQTSIVEKTANHHKIRFFIRPYSESAVLKNRSLKNRSTQKPRLKNRSTQKPQYSKSAVLKIRSLKNRSTQNPQPQNPQYSKTALIKIEAIF